MMARDALGVTGGRVAPLPPPFVASAMPSREALQRRNRRAARPPSSCTPSDTGTPPPTVTAVAQQYPSPAFSGTLAYATGASLKLKAILDPMDGGRGYVQVSTEATGQVSNWAMSESSWPNFEHNADLVTGDIAFDN